MHPICPTQLPILEFELESRPNPAIEAVQPQGLLHPSVAAEPLEHMQLRVVFLGPAGEHTLTGRLLDARWTFTPDPPPPPPAPPTADSSALSRLITRLTNLVIFS